MSAAQTRPLAVVGVFRQHRIVKYVRTLDDAVGDSRARSHTADVVVVAEL